jgi:hypothetical protein
MRASLGAKWQGSVCIPLPIDELCTKNVLVMEYLPGAFPRVCAEFSGVWACLWMVLMVLWCCVWVVFGTVVVCGGRFLVLWWSVFGEVLVLWWCVPVYAKRDVK